jgi:hypothetical protein
MTFEDFVSLRQALNGWKQVKSLTVGVIVEIVAVHVSTYIFKKFKKILKIKI